KNDLTSVRISGFSYENRAVTEEKAMEFPARTEETSFHIGMLHGSIAGDKQHDTYAPFRLQQLLDKHYDYWALGHIHKRQELHTDPPVIYPGNIQSRHRNEQGEKGFYLVELQKDAVRATFQPLDSILFLQLDFALRDEATLEEVEDVVWESLQENQGARFLVSVTWRTDSDYWAIEHSNGFLDDLIDSLNERLYADNDWIYIYKHELHLTKQKTPDYHPHFMLEVEQAFLNMDINEELKELTSHKKGRKFLERPEEALIDEAKQLLFAELLTTKKDG